MDIKEVSKGLKQGKCYQLPGWWRFFIFIIDNNTFLKSPYTEPQEYYFKIDELNSEEWIEVTEEELKNIKD